MISNNFPVVEYPIILILGNRGGGKTLYMTAYAVDAYNLEKAKIYSNYHLFGVPYKYMTLKEMIESLNVLENCILLVDELHVAIDSYKFLDSNVKQFTEFITQIRKRKITLIGTTQRFTLLAKRFRDQVDYIVTSERTRVKGIAKYTWNDLESRPDSVVVWQKVLDLRDYFKYYDTNQIITYE